VLEASPRGLLRITLPVTFGVLRVAPAVSDYMTRYLSRDQHRHRRVGPFRESHRRRVRRSDPYRRIARLWPDRPAARVSSPHGLCGAVVFADGRSTPADLSRHACLTYTETATRGNLAVPRSRWPHWTVHISGPLTNTNPAFVHRMAPAGHGVIRRPSFSLGADVAEGRLVPLLTGWRSHELSIHALYRHTSLLSAKVRGFVDFLAERFAAEPEWERSLRTASLSGPGQIPPRIAA
jgi:DNA-binding transcriptional LysR family regulator